jgi:polar amino acid transport system substrate-binding protein
MKARWALALVPLLFVAGCGSAGVHPAPSAGVAYPRPLNVQDPASVPASPSAPACNARASLRPAGALPAPGRMPAGSTMARIVQRGRLVVGIDQNAYLYSYRDPDTGDLVGFEIDLARAIAKALLGDPRKVQFRAISTADRIPVIRNGSVDMVIRTMTMTCDRWQQVSFSTEYLTSHQRLLVRTGSRIASFGDLAGRKVCATRGSTSIGVIARQPSRPIPVTTESTLDCLVMLEQGQVDAVSTNDTLLAGLAAQDPGTAVVGPLYTNEPSGVGIAKSAPDLVRFVNGVLERYRADGSWLRSYNRWLAPRLGPAAGPPAAVYQGA